MPFSYFLKCNTRKTSRWALFVEEEPCHFAADCFPSLACWTQLWQRPPNCSGLVHSVTPGMMSEDEWTTQDFRSLIPGTPVKVWSKLRELNFGFSWISKLTLSRSIWSPPPPHTQVLPKLCGTPARHWRVKGRNTTLSYGLSRIIISKYTFGWVIDSWNTWPERKAVFKKKRGFHFKQRAFHVSNWSWCIFFQNSYVRRQKLKRRIRSEAENKLDKHKRCVLVSMELTDQFAGLEKAWDGFMVSSRERADPGFCFDIQS